MKNLIKKSKIEKYYNLTSKALEIAKASISREDTSKKPLGVLDKSKQKQAQEIFLMVKCYLEDSQHFLKKKDLVNAYGALNYAHGWLDAGARLKIFKVKDNNLFTV